ncbi:YybH family protein [Amycolatopsis jejuensis]|uniref:YybH family protein n=1 Tax=Amycolatopsis jejuensis TaxID=330084 RepID=UPI00052667F5|nr:nuclear transport factor 2 family protein [Amycolatopsis jejuensis]
MSAARTAPAADVDEILRLHREWWESNENWDIPRMAAVFPDPGDEYLMFNFNGHTYYNLAEKTALWEWYRDKTGQDGGLVVKVLRLEVRGDTAWLAAEGSIGTYMYDGGEWTVDGVPGHRFRATEIYHRDRGDGTPEWRMWHTHISAPAPDDEPRPGFGDTTDQRGLGWVPWQIEPVRDA